MLRAAHGIERAWCDLTGVYLQGWAHLHGTPLLGGALCCAGREAALAFTPRPDVLARCPEVPPGQACGFEAYLACPAFTPVTLRLQGPEGAVEVAVEAGPELGPLSGPEFRREAPLDRFIAAMKEARGTVLEIGARVVGAHSSLMADRFAPECRFLGADIHPAPGVDIVADAHALTQAVAPGSLDGVFSLAVLEHLAAPWAVAAEINRALRPGGLTLHLTAQAYPAHEQPNDFWRMSEEGLKVLFGPATGFEVMDAAVSVPVQLLPPPEFRHGAFLQLPLNHAYAASFILSRKVAELPEGAVRWPLAGMAARSQSYPVHAPPPPAGGLRGLVRRLTRR